MKSVTCQPRFSVQLPGPLSAMALALAAAWGLRASAASMRGHEMDIRLTPAPVAASVVLRRMVLVLGMGLAIVGTAIGVLAALGLARLLPGLLSGVTSTDPVTYVRVTPMLTIVALVASYLPARRAMRVDPLVALRYE